MDTNIITNPNFSKDFMKFFLPLNERFSSWQRDIAKNRVERFRYVFEEKTKVGYKKDYESWPNNLRPRQFETPKFKIDMPTWCQDQRNQMTGPLDDAALVVKMMNSGAPGVMVDIEDSMANEASNLIRAYKNLGKLFRRTLSYKKRGDTIRIKDSNAVLWVRARGLHLHQVIGSTLTSASLLDVCMAAWLFNKGSKLPVKQPLAFYIPKTEYAEEAEWWSTLFKEISKALEWEPDFIKCMVLVEAHSFAYQLPEFIYLMKDHLLGLNLGRWDYMASYMEQNLPDPTMILPDRNTIPHDVAFFQDLRVHLVNTCHSHGILAIGGMTALYPSRKDSELNERALKGLEADKKNEADMGMDGAWTGHPDQNQISVDQFPCPNQLSVIHPFPTNPDLRPPLEGGEATLDGTRQAIRVAIRYRNGVINGRGASLLDGYMEDLATDRGARLQIAQRMRHLSDHTLPAIKILFDEEYQNLVEGKSEPGGEETLRKAKILTERYILSGRHNPT
jgi:malate synthase